MVIFDHIRKTILVVAHAHLGPGGRPRGRLRRRLRPGRRAGRPPRRARPRAGARRHRHRRPGRRSTPASNFTREQYEEVVRHCQEYIKAGDIFQVVPSQRFQVETTAEPFDIYRVLRVVNPSPFLFYLPFGDFCLIGSSPEILVRVEDGDGHDPPAGRHPPPRQGRGRGPGPRRGAAGRPQGAGRAHHARRPRPQRRRPGRRLRHACSSPT